MSYVDENLISGEQVVHRTRKHWSIFVGPTIWLIIGLVLGGIFFGQGEGWIWLGLLTIILSAIPMLKAVIKYLTNEFAVTTRRVMVKQGFIKRETIELNHNQVESLQVSQGIIARLFNAGTVVVNGTGQTRAPVDFVHRPMEFRRNALETIDNSP